MFLQFSNKSGLNTDKVTDWFASPAGSTVVRVCLSSEDDYVDLYGPDALQFLRFVEMQAEELLKGNGSGWEVQRAVAQATLHNVLAEIRRIRDASKRE